MLDSSDDSLRGAALQILQRHPTWADEIVGRLEVWLASSEQTAEIQSSIRGTVLAFWNNEAVERLVARVLNDPTTSRDTKLLLLEAMGTIDSKHLPETWKSALEKILKGSDEIIVTQAIGTVTERGLSSFTPILTEIALNDEGLDSIRCAAATSLLKQTSSVPDGIFQLLIRYYQESEDSIEQLAIAQAFASSALSLDQLQQLVALLADAEPHVLSTLLVPFEKQSDEALGLELVNSLQETLAIDSISNARLKELLITYPESVQVHAKPLLNKLDTDSENRSTRLKELLDQWSDGDARKGREVFFGQKAACYKCHRVGDAGEEVGPNLSRIGEIRSKRDLVEAVIYPSASFAREYEPYLIVTDYGKTYSGILSRQSAQAIYLRLADRSEVRIERENIDEMMPSQSSIMPEGLDKTISPEEFHDLVAFLSSLK